MKTLAGSVAVGHIVQLEDELAQARAERNSASALCKAARSIANAAEDKADNLVAMVEKLNYDLEIQHDIAEANGRGWQKADATIARLREIAGHLRSRAWGAGKECDDLQAERDEARRHACRLLRERNEARAERDKFRLANDIYRDDVRNLHARIVVLKTEGYCD